MPRAPSFARPALALFLAAGVAGAAACRKRSVPTNKEPTKKAAATFSCPPPSSIARALTGEGRTVVVGCHPYELGRFWLAAAFGHGAAGVAPTLELVSGGAGDLTVFEVPVGAAGAEALTQLVRGHERLEVSVRPGQGEGNLLRLGVLGRKPLPGGDEQAEELVALLQLVAHAPPQLLWVGPGDKTVAADGCVIERRVAFQMLFGRVDLVSSERGRRAASVAGAPAPTGSCAGGPGMQESLPNRGAPLAPGRRVSFTATPR